MNAHSASVHRLSSQTVTALFGIFFVALGICSTASAGLLNSTYDIKVTGFVLENGNESTEQYAATNLDLDIGPHFNVPNTISPTPAPPFTSTTTRVNRVTATAVGEVANPPSGLNIEFWVKGPIADSENVFVNDLDPDKLVEVELKLVLDELDFGQKMVLFDAKLVKGIKYNAVSVTTSGTGFAGDGMHPADPLMALIKYNPEDVEDGGTYMKIEFDYNTMTTVVPEPATVTMVGIGCVGLLGLFRRRRLL